MFKILISNKAVSFLTKKILYIGILFANVACYAQAQIYPKQLQNVSIVSMNIGIDSALSVLSLIEKKANKENDIILKALVEGEKSIIYTNDLQIDHAIKLADSAISLGRLSKQNIPLSYAYFARAYANENRNESIEALKDAQKAEMLLNDSKEYIIQEKVSNLLFNLYIGWHDLEKMKYYANVMNDIAIKDGSIMAQYVAMQTNVLNMRAGFKKEDSAQNRIVVNDYHQIQKMYLQHPDELPRAAYVLVLINEIGILCNDPDIIGNKEKIEILKSKASMAVEASKGIKLYESSFIGFLNMIYSNINDYEGGTDQQSVIFLKKAYDALQKRPFRINYENLVLISEVLSSYYEKQGNYKMALLYTNKKAEFSNKLFDIKNSNSIKRLELENATALKNNEIKIIKLKDKNTHNIYLFILIASFLLVIGMFYILRTYQFKVKYAKEKEIKLNLEKEEIALHARLTEEEQKRLLVEKELMLLREDKLQKEVLTSKLQIDHKNDLLNEIKEKLKDGNSINMTRLLKEEVSIDSDFEKIKQQIQEVEPDFFPKLDSLAQQKLTNLDLKISAYIHLNVDTKQIAQNLNIEPKSVRMAKYRLKQKLGLAKEMDLDTFLRQIT